MAAIAHPTAGVLMFGPLGPGQGMTEITPSNTEDVCSTPGKYCRSLYIVTAGDLSIVGADGSTAVVPVPANFVLPVAVSRVNATGTTALRIYAIW